MRLLSVGTSKDVDELKDRLNHELKFFHDKGININIREKIKGSYVFLNYIIYDDDILNNSYDKIVGLFKHHAAKAIAEIIIENWEKKLIKKIIWKNYNYFKEIEKNKIYKFAKTILKDENFLDKKNIVYQTNRKNHVKNKINDYLNTNNEIVIEGFIKFRLKEYFMELEDIVDRAVDEFLMEKEYKEFIKLLKYFVEIQEPKKEFIHVILNRKKFDIFDKNLKTLNKDFLEDFAFEGSENDICYDDLLISVLITIAPKQIIVHRKNNNFKEAIDTIKKIFEGKVIICKGCKICNHKTKNHLEK